MPNRIANPLSVHLSFHRLPVPVTAAAGLYHWALALRHSARLFRNAHLRKAYVSAGNISYPTRKNIRQRA